MESLRVSNVPKQLKQQLVADAQANGQTVSDVAGRILAHYFNHAFRPSGRASSSPTLSDSLSLRVTRLCVADVWAASRSWKMTQSQVVNRILCNEYGIRYDPKKGRGT